MRRPGREVLLQYRLMRRQGTDRRLPVKRPRRVQSAAVVGTQHPLNRRSRHARYLGDQGMRLMQGLEPQHFHAALHQRIGMVVTIPCDLSQYIGWKIKLSHPCVLCPIGP
jgi:hypothetical protein